MDGPRGILPTGMKPILLALLIGVALCGAVRAEQACEDEWGNTYYGDLSEPRNGPRPVGPCLPAGTWADIRDPQHRHHEVEVSGPRGVRIVPIPAKAK